MNRFNRMHDMLIEPPEIDDEDGEFDGMTIAEIHKQQQRDREDFEAERYRQRQEDME
jgi:hypothetical protein